MDERRSTRLAPSKKARAAVPIRTPFDRKRKRSFYN